MDLNLWRMTFRWNNKSKRKPTIICYKSLQKLKFSYIIFYCTKLENYYNTRIFYKIISDKLILSKKFTMTS